jgi:hypothetical protein
MTATEPQLKLGVGSFCYPLSAAARHAPTIGDHPHPRSPICRGSGVHRHRHPRFQVAGDRSIPRIIPIPGSHRGFRALLPNVRLQRSERSQRRRWQKRRRRRRRRQKHAPQHRQQLPRRVGATVCYAAILWLYWDDVLLLRHESRGRKQLGTNHELRICRSLARGARPGPRGSAAPERPPSRSRWSSVTCMHHDAAPCRRSGPSQRQKVSLKRRGRGGTSTVIAARPWISGLPWAAASRPRTRRAGALGRTPAMGTRERRKHLCGARVGAPRRYVEGGLQLHAGAREHLRAREKVTCNARSARKAALSARANDHCTQPRPQRGLRPEAERPHGACCCGFVFGCGWQGTATCSSSAFASALAASSSSIGARSPRRAAMCSADWP